MKKTDDILKLPTGHKPHLSVISHKDKRTKRNRTKSSQKRNAIKEFYT